MIKTIKKSYYVLGASVATGVVMGASSANAAAGKNWGDIAENVTTSIADLPGLVTALSYMFGILLCVLGIMKIKDHVENPDQTPLKTGAIRLAIGGALLALPIVTEAMTSTVGTGTAADLAKVNKVKFSTL